MAMADFIPAGRTSRIVRGTTQIQIQTEYAYRPTPRLTTSIFSGGQVIRKVEKELGSPISSLEDKFKVEGLLRKQHMEVIEILNNNHEFAASLFPSDGSASSPARRLPLAERLAKLSGVEKIFRIDNDGNFESGNLSDEFRKRFSSLFRNLRELLDIFQNLPGGKREQGVYQIERNRLYLISTGLECFFVLARNVASSRDLETELRTVIKN
ncbi:hypothetical protein TRIP_C60134 [Candidatus Zixiibacteriota bacterium]|nr:hypothetical protein TRIP_C60134 [candidate division Zixibacteria bacterium]